MVRKRDAWTRANDRLRIRPKTPAPKTGWLISDLATLSNQPRRTIAYYVQQGLLTKPAFRGTATRYGRDHLLRLLCIDSFKRQGTGTLKQIKQRLATMTEAELQATIAAQSPSAAVATALGLPAQSSTPSHGSIGGAAPAASSPGAMDLPGEPWHRLQLLPGLELLLAADASPAVRQVARQIQVYCAGR